MLNFIKSTETMVIHTSSDSDIGVGFSDRILLGVSIVGLTALMYVVHSLIQGIRSTTNDDDTDAADGTLTEEERLIRCTDVNALNRTQRRARAKAIMKERRRVQNPSHDVVADENVVHQENGVEGNMGENVAPLPTHRVLPPPTLSRKERQQHAKMTEKEERRLLQDEREQQQKKIQLEAQRQKKERMIAATQRLLEEERQKAVEEAAREEKARDLWYNLISTSSSNPTTPTKKTVSEFVQECQHDRVVDIPKMASQYHVEPSYIVDRLQQLISCGRIAGFFRRNENDKPYQFIYLSDDELNSIASITRSRGCVTLQQFTTICQEIMKK
jgi:hypothetical protein